MLKLPEISVVIPAVVVDGQLRDAVQSVLTQAGVLLDVVVVLDGLVSSEIPAEDPVLRDNRVRLIEIPIRAGTPRALNRGIAECYFDLIARLDADDLAFPHRLERQAEFLAEHPDIACVGSSALILNATGARIGKLEVVTGPRHARIELLKRNAFVHSSVMYRRSALTEVNGYDVRCTRMQDYDLFLRIAVKFGVDNMGEALTGYRVHDGQHSRRTSPWALYTRVVMRSRRALATALGEAWWRQLLRDATWFGAQVLRHSGVIRPRYLAANDRSDSRPDR